MNPVAAAVVALVAAWPAAAGCGGDPPRSQPAPAESPNPREDRDREVVATVDGEPIYGAEIEPPGPPRDPAARAVARERYLDNEITRRLLRREAARLGITAADDTALFAAVRAQEVDARIVVTEAELEAEFLAHAQRYPRFPRVHLRQIVIALPADAAPARVETESRRLRDRAAAELAKAPLAEVGTDLGWLEYQLGEGATGDGILADAALRAVAATLTPGAVSPVVRGASGVHLLLCVAKDAGGPPTFESARARVEATVRARARSLAEEAWMRFLHERYRVEIR